MPARDRTGESSCVGSGRAGLVVHELPPAFGEFTPQLTDSPGRDAEPLGDGAGLLALSQFQGDLAVAALESIQPVAEIQADASGFCGPAWRSSTRTSLPRVFGVLELVESFDDQTLAVLAILAQDVQDIQVPADLAIVAGLPHAVASQSDRVRDGCLAELTRRA